MRTVCPHREILAIFNHHESCVTREGTGSQLEGTYTPLEFMHPPFLMSGVPCYLTKDLGFKLTDSKSRPS